MKKFYCILTACLFCFVLTAQNVTEKTKKEMNRIKLSRSYICAEATMPTLQEAIDIANESLLQAIDQWVKEEKKYQGAKQVAIQDINSCLEKMDMNRGNNVRVLVYIKKKDIIPIYGNGQILLTDDEQEETATAQADSPKPVAETVQPEQTSRETPRSRQEQSKPKQEQPQPVQSASAETAPVHKPKQAPAGQEQAPQTSNLQRILAARTMNDIKVIFQELKKDYAITYGKYNSTDLDVSACCLLFYDRQGQVIGILGEGGQERKNLRTNQQESMNRYSGNAAYWFVLTKE